MTTYPARCAGCGAPVSGATTIGQPIYTCGGFGHRCGRATIPIPPVSFVQNIVTPSPGELAELDDLLELADDAMIALGISRSWRGPVAVVWDDDDAVTETDQLVIQSDLRAALRTVLTDAAEAGVIGARLMLDTLFPTAYNLIAPAVTETEHEPWCYRRHTGDCVDGPGVPPAPAVTETADLRAAFLRGVAAREEAERAWASYKGDPRAALDFIADWAHDCIDGDTRYGFDAIERMARAALAGTSDTEEEAG